MKKPYKGPNYEEAMAVKTKEEAAKYLYRLVTMCMEYSGKSRAECETIQRKNLGYFAGYYDDETRERVERLYGCAHPIFGAIAEKGQPTAKQAFEMGKRIWAKLKRKMKKYE